MKYVVLFLFISLFVISCQKTNDYNIEKYHNHVNTAEHAICAEALKLALHEYEMAFQVIKKPFGKDLYNAALVSALIPTPKKRNAFIKQLMNNTEDFSFLEMVFVPDYVTRNEWQQLLSERVPEYNSILRKEMQYITDRDQLFRPKYEPHDDTINAIRKQNLSRIFQLTDSIGYPSHLELGYSKNLRNLPHNIVLHHTAQRRSYDKTVIDLEPLLRSAVDEGRIDPELAIFYMAFQNDTEKGKFEVYSSWQYTHPLLPDSLNNAIWFPKLNQSEILNANSIREEWQANTLEDIEMKIKCNEIIKYPFIFSSIRKSVMQLSQDFEVETALEQYNGMTSFMVKK